MEEPDWAGQALANSIEGLLHPRLTGECLGLLRAGFYSQAAMQAMKEVELALRDKTDGKKGVSGVRLVRMVFDERGFTLHLGLDQEQQKAGQRLFEGAFGYYRNYAAHDGSRVTSRDAGRILVLASELLDMLGASDRRLGGREGLKQLVRSKYGDGATLVKTLQALDGEWFGDDVVDGFFDCMAEAGVTEDQFFAAIETGLIEVEARPTVDGDWDTVTRFALTRDGERVIDWLQEGGI